MPSGDGKFYARLFFLRATLPCLFFFLPTSLSCKIKQHSRKARSTSATAVIPGVSSLPGADGGTVEEDGISVKFPAGTFDSDVQIHIKKLSKALESIDGLTSIGTAYSVSVTDTKGTVIRDLKKPVEITMATPIKKGSKPQKGDFFTEVFDPLSLRLKEILRTASLTSEGTTAQVTVSKSGDLNGTYQVATALDSDQVLDIIWQTDAKVRGLYVKDLSSKSATISWIPPISGIPLGQYFVVLMPFSKRSKLGMDISDETFCNGYGNPYPKTTTTLAFSNLAPQTSYYFAVCSAKDTSSSPLLSLAMSVVFTTLPIEVSETFIPKHPATSLTFNDTDVDASQIGGTVTIGKASSESDVTQYVLYWGSGATTKQSSTPIASIAVTGSNVTSTIATNTNIPTQPAATHLLVFTKNTKGEMSTGISIAITDSIGSWTPTTTTGAPSARMNHSAIWTGSQMIVWGGVNGATYYNTGGVYDPIANSWTATSTTSAPSGRENHTAVWSGSKMIVWGGSAPSTFLDTGGLYDPVTNSWTATQTVSSPVARQYHTAVWSGTKMIIWGGIDYNNVLLNDGGLYDPVANSWSPTSSTNAPNAKMGHSAVWTGAKMIVWGGLESTPADSNTGKIYDPVANSWSATTTSGAASPRYFHSAVWTGSKMIVWGGLHYLSGTYRRENSGGIYDPALDYWTALSTNGAPDARSTHSAVWTGSKMVIFGGNDGGANASDDGGLFDPIANTWSPLTRVNAPSRRGSHSAVWTGTSMIVFGGYDYNSSLSVYYNSGGIFTPGSTAGHNTWSPTTSTNAPDTRYAHTALWTGSQMLIWGGNTYSGLTYNGMLYDPVANSWSTISSSGSPTPRFRHTAVWTGGKMIVWGGESGAYLNDGGIYDLSTDTWSATASSGLGARRSHTAVWTGSKMIIFGGVKQQSGVHDDGAVYDPIGNSWTPTQTSGQPGERAAHAAVWTGSKMIIWGGQNVAVQLNDGGQYDPVANTWTATQTTGAPTGRSFATAVWTGSKMIIWGGGDVNGGQYDPSSNSWTAVTTTNAPDTWYMNTAVWSGSKMIVWGGYWTTGGPVTYYNSGGLYDPVANSWTATSTGSGVPSGRTGHTAVWTGSSMIIWGGAGEGDMTPGGIYTP